MHKTLEVSNPTNQHISVNSYRIIFEAMIEYRLAENTDTWMQSSKAR